MNLAIVTSVPSVTYKSLKSHSNRPVYHGSMHDGGFVSVPMDSTARDEIREHGFTRRRLSTDLEVARALGDLAHAD
jgi:hypothetical protein